jgi:hypothetical protein
MATVICKMCGEEKDESNFKHENGKLRRRICFRCFGKRERAQLKLDMIEALGGKCACCGESHPFFLSLDHVSNDGAMYREKYNEQQIYRLARREGWPKDKYQLLCMNCNFAKGHFGECPHKLGLTIDDAFARLRREARTGFYTRHDNTPSEVRMSGDVKELLGLTGEQFEQLKNVLKGQT